MSAGISAIAWGAIAAATIGYAVASTQKAPSIPPPPQPIAPPESQAAKAPDANSAMRAMNGTGQAGGAPGVAQTFLTGAGGVDQNSLLLGKSTLLGA